MNAVVRRGSSCLQCQGVLFDFFLAYVTVDLVFLCRRCLGQETKMTLRMNYCFSLFD